MDRIYYFVGCTFLVSEFKIVINIFSFVAFFSVGHWLILAYGIMSLTMGNLLLLIMVPLPALFYIFTVKFTDPSEFRDRDERSH